MKNQNLQEIIQNKLLDKKIFEPNNLSQKNIAEIIELLSVYEAELLAQNEQLSDSVEQLEIQNQHNKVLFQNAPIPYIIIDEEYLIKQYNRMADSYFAYSTSRLPKQSLLSSLHTNSYENFFDWLSKEKFLDHPLAVEMKVTHNEIRTFMLSGDYMDEEDHNKNYLLMFTDITEDKNNAKKLQKLLDHQKNIVILSNGSSIEYCNKSFIDYFGYESLEEFLQEYDCICEKFIKNDRFFHMGKISKNEHWIEAIQTELSHRKIVTMFDKDGEVHAFDILIDQFDRETYFINFLDISDSVLRNIELENKVIRDKLTNAYNREYFEQNIQKLLKKSETKGMYLALSYIDIDYFKKINDQYGHDVGDTFLIEFVTIIQKSSRADDIFIRWGGEEFILILNIKSENDLIKVLEHIRKVVEEYDFTIVGQRTCSIGSTIYRQYENISHTIKRADGALYQAKTQGRNRVIIY